jgi:hypothetical protein
MNACYVDSNIASTPTGAGFARRPVRGSSGPARPSQWPHHDALLPSGTDGPHRGRGEGVGDRAPQPPGFDAKSVNRWSAKWLIKRSYYGAPGEIRTPGLLVRSQALYPTELRAQMIKRRAAITGRRHLPDPVRGANITMAFEPTSSSAQILAEGIKENAFAHVTLAQKTV